MRSASLPQALSHGPASGAAEGIQPEPATPPESGLNREMPIEVMRNFDAEEDGAAYPCQVVRATPRWGGFFEYGLQFVHLDGEQQKHLTQEIQTIQEETRKELLFDQKHTGWPGGSRPERK